MFPTLQFGTVRLQRWAASACVLLMLLFAGVEAVHTHSQASAVGSGTCLLCVSARTSAPTASITAVGTLFVAIGLIAAIPERRRPITLTPLPLFIRPPPSI